MWYPLTALSVLSLAFGADPSPTRAAAAPEAPAKQIFVSGVPPQPQYQPESPYNVNLLEPQYQFPQFHYMPDKQPSYPRMQPPIIFYAGAAPPGQQFLLRPGAPPGNFLIPQPQPQPQPQPGIYYPGNPQGPSFIGGYPKPAFQPPIEKDAEEVPNLAGNHPTNNARPLFRPNSVGFNGIRPEKLETFDEPQTPQGNGSEEKASVHPKKVFPTKPILKPGQRFFILNGNPLYSNYPLEGVAAENQPKQPLPPVNPELFIYRQYVHDFQPQQQYDQVPVQDLFLRNSITGQIADIKSHQPQFRQENFVALNQPSDFRQNYFVKNVPVEIVPQGPLLVKAYPNPKLENAKQENVHQSRYPKEIEFLQQPFMPIYAENVYPNAFIDYYSDGKNVKDEDDTVVVDAKVSNEHDNKNHQNDEQNDDENDSNDNNDSESEEVAPSKAENPSLSQSQPAAIALAGKGGVAAAAPRGTALTGDRGLAVARPVATAVAGPTDEESESKTKSKKERLQ